MIECRNLTKAYDDVKAVNCVSMTIKEGAVFGLIGTNGAGKSTVLRMMAGVLEPDRGHVFVDSMPIYDNASAKAKIFFIADEPYFFAGATPEKMAAYYATVYKRFDMEKFRHLLELFALDGKRKVSTFSKGMRKQLAILLGLSACTEYLYCDETFDGLDPVMRQGVKSLFAKEMEERNFTPVIASHNLRELEDICDHVGLMHKGGVLFSQDLEDMKMNIQKIQVVFRDKEEENRTIEKLQVMQIQRRGSLVLLTVRGARDDVEMIFSTADTLFYEILPLSLEEIFISETEVKGYDIKKLILE